jgi:hypothetical protein
MGSTPTPRSIVYMSTSLDCGDLYLCLPPEIRSQEEVDYIEQLIALQLKGIRRRIELRFLADWDEAISINEIYG